MLNWLVGGSKTADKLIDGGLDAVKGVGNYIDEQDFTQEEKAKHKAELLRSHTEFILRTQQENGARAISRRIIAWSIIGSDILILFICVGLYLMGNKVAADGITKMMVDFQSTPAFIAIIAFYFGSHLLQAKK